MIHEEQTPRIDMEMNALTQALQKRNAEIEDLRKAVQEAKAEALQARQNIQVLKALATLAMMIISTEYGRNMDSMIDYVRSLK